MSEIWIVGATGRTGREIAAKLTARGVRVGLVGRDVDRLRGVAGGIGGDPRIVVAGPPDAVAAEINQHRPAVVVNTVGPFTETAVPIATACIPGTHYVDLSNEIPAMNDLLHLHEHAVAGGTTVVPGAGFGVLGTESVVHKLCEGRPNPSRVRVDALPHIESDGTETVGAALSASLIDNFALGGRRYEHGKLVRARLGGDFERFTLPDGVAAGAAAAPFGELVAAQRASGAPSVVAGSGELPSNRLIRALLPALSGLLSIPPVGRAAKRMLARVRVPATNTDTGKSQFTWAHGRLTWPDGDIQEGWLRVDDAMEFTTTVAAEVALRLSRGEGSPGTHTPGALFGPELAEQAGGEFVLNATKTA